MAVRIVVDGMRENGNSFSFWDPNQAIHSDVTWLVRVEFPRWQKLVWWNDVHSEFSVSRSGMYSKSSSKYEKKGTEGWSGIDLINFYVVNMLVEENSQNFCRNPILFLLVVPMKHKNALLRLAPALDEKMENFTAC